MRVIATVALVLTFLAANAQTSLGNFDQVNAWGNVEVTLIPGTSNSYIATRHADNLKIQVDGSTLKISHRNKLESWNSRIEVQVTYKELREINGSAGSKIVHEEALESSELELHFDTGASAKIELEARSVFVQVGEGSIVGLKGETVELKAKATTGGILKSSGLEAETVQVTANTGGQLNVYAKEAIEARASTGGVIFYSGNPEKVNSREATGGHISG